MVHVVLLGTGTPNPDPERSGSSVAVVAGDRWLLVDCGRGVAQRVLQAGLDLSRVDVVALTHHHSDHVSDLASLAIARWVAGSSSPLRVIAPKGPCSRFAHGCLDGYEDEAFYSQAAAGSSSRPSVRVIEFEPAPSLTVVFDESGWSVSSALVDHHPIEAAVGYRIAVDGRVVAISGDTAVCAGVELLAHGADILIHEAARSDQSSPRLLEWNASAFSVGVLADSLSLPVTVLTHLLPAPNTEADELAFVEEVRASGYTGEVVLATDLMRIDLTGQERRS